MPPPDLYRSEAFAEDLPDGGYEPLALKPVRPQTAPTDRAQSLLNTVRAAFSARSRRPPRRAGGAAAQGT